MAKRSKKQKLLNFLDKYEALVLKANSIPPDDLERVAPLLKEMKNLVDSNESTISIKNEDEYGEILKIISDRLTPFVSEIYIDDVPGDFYRFAGLIEFSGKDGNLKHEYDIFDVSFHDLPDPNIKIGDIIQDFYLATTLELGKLRLAMQKGEL